MGSYSSRPFDILLEYASQEHQDEERKQHLGFLAKSGFLPTAPAKGKSTAHRRNIIKAALLPNNYAVIPNGQGVNVWSRPFVERPVTPLGNKGTSGAIRKDVNKLPRTPLAQSPKIQKPHNLATSHASVKLASMKNVSPYSGQYEIRGDSLLRKAETAAPVRHHDKAKYIQVSIEGGKLFTVNSLNQKVPCVLKNKNSFSSIYIFPNKRR